jgi:hypothetical protein
MRYINARNTVIALAILLAGITIGLHDTNTLHNSPPVRPVVDSVRFWISRVVGKSFPAQKSLGAITIRGRSNMTAPHGKRKGEVYFLSHGVRFAAHLQPPRLQLYNL